MQGESDRGVYGPHVPRGLGEGPREHEDPDHHQDVPVVVDALREDGTCNTGKDDGTGGMVSFNHYASGAVGDFLYRRIAGIEATEGGYRSFRIQPLTGGNLKWAKGSVNTAYGTVSSEWKIEDGMFTIQVQFLAPLSCSDKAESPAPETPPVCFGVQK